MFFLSLVGISGILVISIKSSVQTKEIEKSPINATTTGTTVPTGTFVEGDIRGCYCLIGEAFFGAAWCRIICCLYV